MKLLQVDADGVGHHFGPRLWPAAVAVAVSYKTLIADAPVAVNEVHAALRFVARLLCAVVHVDAFGVPVRRRHALKAAATPATMSAQEREHSQRKKGERT